MSPDRARVRRFKSNPFCDDQEMTDEELITSKLEAVDEPEMWQESVRELRGGIVQLGRGIDGLERRLAALEDRD